MATTGTPGTAASNLPTTGGTSSAGLADWAAPYITNYLGKAQALSETPYQAYGGPLTAGASNLQTQAFQGIGNLTVGDRGTYTPVGGSFTDQYAFGADGGIGGMGQPMQGGVGSMPIQGGMPQTQSTIPGRSDFSAGFAQPRSVAEQYMNPFIQQALDPQLRELQRQSDIARLADAGRLTQAGAFGGGRQAIMEAEGRRNLLGKQSDVLGQGYATAFDKAMAQYNAEQDRKVREAQFGADFGLKGLAAEQGILKDQLTAGATQRGIESEGIAADLAEFEKQREFPYKQVQFQRDMISGLPTGSVTNTPAQLSGIAQLISAAGGIDKLLKNTGQRDLGSLLKSFGFDFGNGVLP